MNDWVGSAGFALSPHWKSVAKARPGKMSKAKPNNKECQSESASTLHRPQPTRLPPQIDGPESRGRSRLLVELLDLQAPPQTVCNAGYSDGRLSLSSQSLGLALGLHKVHIQYHFQFWIFTDARAAVPYHSSYVWPQAPVAAVTWPWPFSLL